MLLIGSLKNGGAEKSIVKLANELAKDNNVYLVVADKSNQDYYAQCEIIEIKELRNKFTKLIAISKIKKLKRSLCIDISISYTTVFNYINVVTKNKEKIVISIRNFLSCKEKNKIYKMLHLISCKKANIIVCCSKAVRYDQITNYHINPNKIVVIENFYDSDILDNLIKEPVNYNDYIITISRLEKHKNLDVLIKAFQLVYQERKNLKLIILGRGKEENNLRKLISDLNLNNEVYLLGFVSNPYKYLKNAKCFVLTSSYEGFSNSIIEAMSCSCPVVAINSPGGNREILTDCYYGQRKNEKKYYGFLLPDYDIVKLKDAIIDLSFKKNAYYRKKSIERSKMYTKKTIMRKWNDIL